MDPIVAGAFIDGSASSIYSTERILGVRLRKFCLWHRLLLNTIDSPFMRKGAVTMFDLRVAVGICRLRYQECNVRKPWLAPSLIVTGATLALLLPSRRRSAPRKENARQRALRKRCDRFLAYCQDYLQSPEYIIIPPPRGKNYTPQTPRGRFDDAIEHAGELISWGIPERDAWEMPLGRANVYRIMARRAAGIDIDVETEEEKQFQREIIQASLKKERNGT